MLLKSVLKVKQNLINNIVEVTLTFLVLPYNTENYADLFDKINLYS